MELAPLPIYVPCCSQNGRQNAGESLSDVLAPGLAHESSELSALVLAVADFAARLAHHVSHDNAAADAMLNPDLVNRQLTGDLSESFRLE